MSMNRIYAGLAIMAVGSIGVYVTSSSEQQAIASLGNSDQNVTTLAMGDPLMAASRESARATFDGFWTKANGPESGTLKNVSIKVGVEHANGVEHLWMSACVSPDGQRFGCTVSNDPVDVPLKLGTRYSFERAAISDWMYLQDEKIHGGYSIRALVPTMPAEQAQAFTAMLAPLPE